MTLQEKKEFFRFTPFPVEKWDILELCRFPANDDLK